MKRKKRKKNQNREMGAVAREKSVQLPFHVHPLVHFARGQEMFKKYDEALSKAESELSVQMQAQQSVKLRWQRAS